MIMHRDLDTNRHFGLVYVTNTMVRKKMYENRRFLRN